MRKMSADELISSKAGTSRGNSFCSSTSTLISSQSPVIGSCSSSGLQPDSGGTVVSVVCESGPPQSLLQCERCKSKFKTRQGYFKHKVLHVQKDYMSKVSSDDLSLKCQECVEPILRQMMDEPDVGDEKKTFIAALIPLLSGEEWGRFYFSVFDFVSEVVFRRSKVLPQKQHACNLKELAFWLSSSSNRLHLHELLSDVLMAPDSLVNLVIYRFSVKLYECAELQFLRLLSPPKTVDSSSIDIEIGMEEKQTLYYALGSVMRNFVVKGKKCDVSASVSARRRCVMERFLFKDESVYSEEFLKIKLWFDKLDRGGLIAADENVFNFVVDLELIIRNCFHDQVLDNESVLNKIFEASHCHMLSFWNDVTQGIMVESDALLFLDTFVRRFISFSGRAEAGLRRRKFYGTVQDRPVALRTGLKSNPKKKK